MKEDRYANSLAHNQVCAIFLHARNSESVNSKTVQIAKPQKIDYNSLVRILITSCETSNSSVNLHPFSFDEFLICNSTK